jgi:hypothetical protein
MISPEQDIRAALAYLNPDDREEWVKAGMAIKAEVGESGYSIWNEWGQGSATHKERDAQSVWKSFKKNGVGSAHCSAWPWIEVGNDRETHRRQRAATRNKKLRGFGIMPNRHLTTIPTSSESASNPTDSGCTKNP